MQGGPLSNVEIESMSKITHIGQIKAIQNSFLDVEKNIIIDLFCYVYLSGNCPKLSTLLILFCFWQ